MRKLAFRFAIIAIFLFILLDINNSPEYNYTTSIKSNITGEVIDIRDIAASLKDGTNTMKVEFEKVLSNVLAEFGFGQNSEG